MCVIVHVYRHVTLYIYIYMYVYIYICFPKVKWDVKPPLNSASPRLQIPIAPGEAHVTGVAIRVAGAGGKVAAPGGVRQILTGFWMVILW